MTTVYPDDEAWSQRAGSEVRDEDYLDGSIEQEREEGHMSGYVTNIEVTTLQNEDYRRVLYTGRYSQLVVMSLRPGEEIGNEVHGLDQFIRIERGQAKAVLNGTEEHMLEGDWAIVIPAGTWHNIVNTGEGVLKLYTLYSPPEHKAGTVHPSKEDEREEHFDGRTSEDMGRS